MESFQERGSDEETEMYIMGIDSEIAMVFVFVSLF